jgi:glycine C-acetyltransferase
MNDNFAKRLGKEIEDIKTAGLYKNERIITSEQGAEIQVGGKTVLIMFTGLL